VIKTISDAVMVRASDPAGAVALGLLTVGQSLVARADPSLAAPARWGAVVSARRICPIRGVIPPGE
jgi:hypothetical protein